jgi:outer membrane protein TolC
MENSKSMVWLLVLAALLNTLQAVAGPPGLTLQQAVAMAQARDPWLQGSLLQQQALQASGVSAGTLPDPRFEVAFANLPLDSFDFNKEPMTQFKVGVAQTFSRGHSRRLERERFELLSERQPLLRQDREARVAVVVSKLWLDAYQARETIRLIAADRSLFEYLVEVSQATYSSGVGATRQQDIIRAQLELTRLDDRLAMLQQNFDTALGRLLEWLAKAYPEGNQPQWLEATKAEAFTLADELPAIEVPHIDRLTTAGPLDSRWVAGQLLQHPAIRGFDKEIDAEQVDVEIAEQNFKPLWGVNASYGYRENGPEGMQRDDFFSIGVTFDLPIFTANRQQQDLQASIAESEAVKTEKWLLLRSMNAELDAARAQLIRLEQRRSLYQQQLLRQMHDQAEAALSAYTSDDGDFAEVVRARIAELNANIDALDIEVGRLKALSEIGYFFAGTASSQAVAQGDER